MFHWLLFNFLRLYNGQTFFFRFFRKSVNLPFASLRGTIIRVGIITIGSIDEKLGANFALIQTLFDLARQLFTRLLS